MGGWALASSTAQLSAGVSTCSFLPRDSSSTSIRVGSIFMGELAKASSGAKRNDCTKNQNEGTKTERQSKKLERGYIRQSHPLTEPSFFPRKFSKFRELAIFKTLCFDTPFTLTTIRFHILLGFAGLSKEDELRRKTNKRSAKIGHKTPRMSAKASRLLQHHRWHKKIRKLFENKFWNAIRVELLRIELVNNLCCVVQM